MLTAAEQKWINEMDKLSKRKPKNLLIYSTDSWLIVCKEAAALPANYPGKSWGRRSDIILTG